MKHIELSMLEGEMTLVSNLPEEVKGFITDDLSSVMVINYPLLDTSNLVVSPTLDWDMGDENISRSIVNLKTLVSVGVFNGPSCDVYQKIDENESAWIFYQLIDESILIKI